MLTAQGVVLAFLALYVPLVGWRLQRRLGLYLVGLYVLSQVPPLACFFMHCPCTCVSAHQMLVCTTLYFLTPCVSSACCIERIIGCACQQLQHNERSAWFVLAHSPTS